jgi:hypothetical protein
MPITISSSDSSMRPSIPRRTSSKPDSGLCTSGITARMESTTRARADQTSAPGRLADRAADEAQQIKNRNAQGEDKPMGSRLALVAIYNGLVGAFLLAGVATHKLSRVITKDRVTSPLRAPFTEFEEEGGPGEIEEEPRGRGLRRAIGELLVCPFCLGQWVATAILAGLAVAPRTTRFVCSIFAVVAIGDFLQIFYKGSEEKLL